jgi:hypothetical protein
MFDHWDMSVIFIIFSRSHFLHIDNLKCENNWNLELFSSCSRTLNSSFPVLPRFLSSDVVLSMLHIRACVYAWMIPFLSVHTCVSRSVHFLNMLFFLVTSKNYSVGANGLHQKLYPEIVSQENSGSLNCPRYRKFALPLSSRTQYSTYEIVKNYIRQNARGTLSPPAHSRTYTHTHTHTHIHSRTHAHSRDKLSWLYCYIFFVYVSISMFVFFSFLSHAPPPPPPPSPYSFFIENLWMERDLPTLYVTWKLQQFLTFFPQRDVKFFFIRISSYILFT